VEHLGRTVQNPRKIFRQVKFLTYLHEIPSVFFLLRIWFLKNHEYD
jgi:hypothetical protein